MWLLTVLKAEMSQPSRVWVNGIAASKSGSNLPISITCLQDLVPWLPGNKLLSRQLLKERRFRRRLIAIIHTDNTSLVCSCSCDPLAICRSGVWRFLIRFWWTSLFMASSTEETVTSSCTTTSTRAGRDKLSTSGKASTSYFHISWYYIHTLVKPSIPWLNLTLAWYNIHTLVKPDPNLVPHPYPG